MAPGTSLGGDEKVVAASKSAYSKWSNDCSGFLRNVASQLGYNLSGNADALVDTFRKSWRKVESVNEVLRLVREGYLVVAGLKSKEHNPPRNNGHVVVIVDGPLYNGRYPRCWGGSIGSAQSQGTKSVGEVWNRTDRDKVEYFVAP